MIRSKTSLAAKSLLAWLRLTNRKRTYAELDRFRRSIESSQAKGDRGPIRSIRRRFDVQRSEVDGRPCYTIRPPGGGDGKRVLYFHGGAYVHQIQHDHWRFFGRLIDRTGCAVTVPIYPLAPEHQCPETTAFVRRAYDVFSAGAGPEEQIVMGDSAGAGIALALTKALRDEGSPVPKETVLLSPWLDLTMTHPAQPALDRRDPYLALTGLNEAARLYSGRLPRTDPRLSPLSGDLSGLGALSVYIGTKDVLLSDARRLRTLCTEQGVPLSYHEYEGMIHAWMLASIPEARLALEEIAHLVDRSLVKTV
ncbi:alpha/beta hydrolase [Amycolatopsis decaplanina]|uniref:Esterase/lipase n=1 Tax=Amycolatopsis decaplanina DSM 44594 TaxID=1284240 RepID=M2XIJ7_9PSEU|nr:alpha/beta hydrolase [Amycolatopsis decaplanina]EME60861.1 esterase/lipase [Amycolatopsis decaplanina DSM 44594]